MLLYLDFGERTLRGLTSKVASAMTRDNLSRLAARTDHVFWCEISGLSEETGGTYFPPKPGGRFA